LHGLARNAIVNNCGEYVYTCSGGLREFGVVAVSVIPVKTGIQKSWMPDQVGHDKASATVLIPDSVDILTTDVRADEVFSPT
jgi:hypothetical protein